ncbi:hypothetical protein FHY55_09755 [Oceanicola sp. D3]|uniref:hypothetical protein n=1 Tax=Oceanicola sp. D3 TaxID=2587163 RepID=UPI001121B722|nr:hypothetical protein [Oceanicola sp. D3]QDC09511.1 hypothetical protein FHY55_09755 [Oceanicola sp. D3]
MPNQPRRPLGHLLLQIAGITLFLLTGVCIIVWIIAYNVMTGLSCGHTNYAAHCPTTSSMDLSREDFLLLVVAPGLITGAVFTLALVVISVSKKRHAKWQDSQSEA